MRIEQLMTKQPRTCRTGDGLDAAARIMWDHDIGAVPVIAENGRLAGIITDRDVCMAALFTGASLAAIPVREHMSRQVFTVTPEDSVETAEEVMAAQQVRRLPVLSSTGEVVGMVTLSDLTRAAVESKRKELDVGAVASTMSRIVRGRQLVASA